MRNKILLSKIFCLLSMIFTTFWGEAQNIVPNPNLESYIVCPDSISQFNRCTDWFIPTTSTTDYFNSCASPSSNVDVPLNQTGNQGALSGDGYGGLYVWITPITAYLYREYMECKLNTPMIQGQKYFVSFYVSLADDSKYYTDDIGAAFTIDSLLQNTSFFIPFIPQIENPSGQYLTDKNNWTKISGEYVAVGGEQFITIGNFKNDANTSVFPSSGLYNYSYYYVDNICVSVDSLTCNTINGINSILSDHGFTVSPNPFNDHIKVDSDFNEPLEFIIYDSIGRKLFSKLINEEILINTDELPDGIYYYQLQKNALLVKSGKLIKQ